MSIKYYTDEQVAVLLSNMKEMITEKDDTIAILNTKIRTLEEVLEMYRNDKLKDIPTLAELRELRNA